MNYLKSYSDYIAGKEFSAGLRMKVAGFGSKMHERSAYLESLAEGKTILHVGCLDHVPLIAPRIKSGRWLHKRLTDCAKICLGIDIQPAGISVAQQYGYDNIVCHDMLSDKLHPLVIDRKWDFMILADLLEHVNNPVQFLEKTREKYASNVSAFVISVPNAFHLTGLLSALRGIEGTNTDHRYGFTPFTLAKIAYCAGFDAVDYELCLHKPNVTRRIIYRAMLRFFPLLRGSLVMTISPSR